MQFICPVCPYKHSISQKWSVNVPTKKKELDDVLGGEEAWKNKEKTEHRCNECGDALDVAEVDHIVALHQLDAQDLDSFQAICGQCHEERPT